MSGLNALLPKQAAYRPDIDGLRALAVISAVLYHAGLPDFASGFLGVDIFFVISGYLISGIIFREVRQRQFTFANFFARRARRILPALFTVVATVTLISCAMLSAGELTLFINSAHAALIGTSNRYFATQVDYFLPDAALNPLLMTWSLGVEMQFYLAFPFLMWLLLRLPRTLRALIIGGLIAASLRYGLALLGVNPMAVFYLLQYRAWELLAGALLAVWHDKNLPSHPPRAQNLLALCGLACYGYGLHAQGTWHSGMGTIWPVAGTLLLIHTPESIINRRLLAARPVVFVGLISYSWYLWHWPLMSLARLSISRAPSIYMLLGIAAASFMLACLSWRWVECPFRRRRHGPWRTLAHYALLLSAMLFALHGLRPYAASPARLPEAVAQVEKAMAHSRGNACLTRFYSSRIVVSKECLPPDDGRPAIALLGDSHAAALAPGLKEWAEAHGARMLPYAKTGCMPVSGYAPLVAQLPRHAQECERFGLNAQKAILDDASVKLVVITASWPLQNGFRQDYRVTEGPDKDKVVKSDEAIAKGLPVLVRRFTQAGKQVLLVDRTPSFSFDPARAAIIAAMPLRHWLSHVLDVNFALPGGTASPDKYKFASTEIRNTLTGIPTADAKAHYLNLLPVYCDGGQCRFNQEGELLFVDYHHLSALGSRIIPWNLAPYLFNTPEKQQK